LAPLLGFGELRVWLNYLVLHMVNPRDSPPKVVSRLRQHEGVRHETVPYCVLLAADGIVAAPKCPSMWLLHSVSVAKREEQFGGLRRTFGAEKP
jgi:hypothetical protein